MKVLLTGAAGMVGRNATEHELANKHEVLVPRRKELDLTNRTSVDDYFAAYKPDFVIHAAGKVGGIQANIREPVDFLVENFEMGRNVIMAARRNGVRRLLNLASSCMYPKDAANPLSEEQILSGHLEPTNEGYALAKISIMKLCQYVSSEDESFQYKTLVPCNLYGPYDSFDDERSHLIPAIIKKVHVAKQHQTPIEIWGKGQARREFLYVGDIADCIWRCVEEFSSMPMVMNAGLGRDYSINEYYELAAQVIGFNGGFAHDLNKPVGMQQKLMDSTKATEWGWSSKTDLVAGLELTYQYFLQRFSE